MLTSFLYIQEPVVNMRQSPSQASKVVSQALFSEKIVIQEKSNDWAYIVTPDGYLGWVPIHSFVARKEPYHTTLNTTRLASLLYRSQNTEYEPIKILPYNSKLHILDATDSRWIKIALPTGEECYIQRGDTSYDLGTQWVPSKKNLIQLSHCFLGLPYTWGGRSSFGYDCSGFVQMLYNQIGIPLQRDAKQQILDPRFQITDLEHIEPGDLIFFGQSKQKITHVGMYLDSGQFIHATAAENQPWIRISKTTDLAWGGQEETLNPYREIRQLRIG